MMGHFRRLSFCLNLLMGACTLGGESSGDNQKEESVPWRVTGLYDASALMWVGDAHRGEPGTSWNAEGDLMVSSCGPAKLPYGLAVRDSDAMFMGATPTLAIVLRASKSTTELNDVDVVVAVGKTQPERSLRPAVLPRALKVQVAAAPTDQRRQDDAQGSPEKAPILEENLEELRALMRAQLEISLCLEHKTGRGWIGGESAQDLRQAFLLDEVSPEADGFYVGEGAPVPALLGPPLACLDVGKSESDRQNVVRAGNKRQESDPAGGDHIKLVSADVFGAGLLPCPENDQEQAAEVAQKEYVSPPWQTLSVTLSAEARDESSEVTGGSMVGKASGPATARVVVALDETERYSGPAITGGDMVYPVTSDPSRSTDGTLSGPSLTDVLSNVPFRFPTVVEGEFRYTVLLVPNWQIVRALERWSNDGALKNEQQDAVGWLLANPQYLFVQLKPKGVVGDDAKDSGGDDSGDKLFNLLSPASGSGWRSRDWGYSLGAYAARSPVFLPSGHAEQRVVLASSEQAAAAQRASGHGTFLLTLGVNIAFVLMGLRRLTDLWVRVPEEREDYWPGPLFAPEHTSAQPPQAAGILAGTPRNSGDRR